ncbi:MAG: hypothetical protein RIC95_13460 [Vicingaceae bacterium]
MNWKKVLLLLFGVLLLLLFFAIFWLSKPSIINYVDHKLKVELEGSPIQYYGLELAFFPLSISVDSLHYLDAETNSFLKLNRLDISIIHLLPFLKNKALQIDQLNIQELKASILKGSKQDIVSTQSTPKPFPFKKIIVGEFKLMKGQSFLLHSLEDSTSTQIDGTKLYLTDIQLDSNEWNSISFSEFKLDLDSICHKGKKVAIKSKQVLFSKDSAQIINFELIDQVADSYPYQKTKYKLLAKTTKLFYDLDSLLLTQQYRFDLLKVEEFELASALDKRKSRKTETKASLNQVLEGIPFSFHLDSISLTKGSIHYKEIVSHAPFVSEVFFEDVSLSSTQLTNDSLEIKDSKWFKNKLNCLFLGKSPLACQINFDLASKSSYHHVKGRMEKLSFKELNPILAPMVDINFKSGDSDQLLFDFNGNYYRSKGSLKFYYKDLKIQLHGADESKTKKLWRNIAGGLANALVIRTDNPHNGLLKEGEIHFDRNHDKSIFNFWWKSIFSGMTKTVLKIDPQKLK